MLVIPVEDKKVMSQNRNRTAKEEIKHNKVSSSEIMVENGCETDDLLA